MTYFVDQRADSQVNVNGLPLMKQEENLQFLRFSLFIQTYDNLQQVGNVFTTIWHIIHMHMQVMGMSENAAKMSCNCSLLHEYKIIQR